MADPAAPAAGPVRLPSEGHRYEITLSDYGRNIVKRRLVVFLTFISVLSGAIFYTNMQTPLYQANSAIRVAAAVRAFQAEGMYMQQLADPMSSYANRITSALRYSGPVARQRLFIQKNISSCVFCLSIDAAAIDVKPVEHGTPEEKKT